MKLKFKDILPGTAFSWSPDKDHRRIKISNESVLAFGEKICYVVPLSLASQNDFIYFPIANVAGINKIFDTPNSFYIENYIKKTGIKPDVEMVNKSEIIKLLQNIDNTFSDLVIDSQELCDKKWTLKNQLNDIINDLTGGEK